MANEEENYFSCEDKNEQEFVLHIIEEEKSNDYLEQTKIGGFNDVGVHEGVGDLEDVACQQHVLVQQPDAMQVS